MEPNAREITPERGKGLVDRDNCTVCLPGAVKKLEKGGASMQSSRRQKLRSRAIQIGGANAVPRVPTESGQKPRFTTSNQRTGLPTAHGGGQS